MLLVSHEDCAQTSLDPMVVPIASRPHCRSPSRVRGYESLGYVSVSARDVGSDGIFGLTA